MKTLTLKVADFSKMPMGRNHPDDGDFTGQRYREEYLEPIFLNYKKIIIDLDDLYACPSSFREEAFGGLARKYGINEVLQKLEFISDDFPELIIKIQREIKESKNKK